MLDLETSRLIWNLITGPLLLSNNCFYIADHLRIIHCTAGTFPRLIEKGADKTVLNYDVRTIYIVESSNTQYSLD